MVARTRLWAGFPMDQTMVDLGPDLPAVAVGDGSSCSELGARVHGCAELAARMGTITYEVTCLSARVTREFDDD